MPRILTLALSLTLALTLALALSLALTWGCSLHQAALNSAGRHQHRDRSRHEDPARNPLLLAVLASSSSLAPGLTPRLAILLAVCPAAGLPAVQTARLPKSSWHGHIDLGGFTVQGDV
ncbi:MAG: hypothetical protein HYY09_08505 [Firmicutes bacterium]|nr:hypothetical protein [Bacillota bacterium]